MAITYRAVKAQAITIVALGNHFQTHARRLLEDFAAFQAGDITAAQFTDRLVMLGYPPHELLDAIQEAKSTIKHYETNGKLLDQKRRNAAYLRMRARSGDAPEPRYVKGDPSRTTQRAKGPLISEWNQDAEGASAPTPEPNQDELDYNIDPNNDPRPPELIAAVDEAIRKALKAGGGTSSK